MSIRFETKTPQNLLNAFKKAIDDGRFVTLLYDSDGDFTHTTPQWKQLAWLRHKIIKDERLILSIIKPKDKNISPEVYAIYHGRFIESMLVHCDSIFKNSIVTAMAYDDDLVQ